jgi:anaerobic selenocysteine-containing dehydrogenase
VKHKDRKIRLVVPQLLDWLRSLDPTQEENDPNYPFILVAGQRRSYNANQIFRNPAWRKDDPDGALRIHPDDIAALGAVAGGWMAVETHTGRLVARVEADDSLRRGVVALPHGYGQAYPPDGAGKRLVAGPRINIITSSEDCDPIAATPYHKNVRVRLAPLDPVSATEAEANSVRTLAAAPA